MTVTRVISWSSLWVLGIAMVPALYLRGAVSSFLMGAMPGGEQVGIAAALGLILLSYPKN